MPDTEICLFLFGRTGIDYAISIISIMDLPENVGPFSSRFSVMFITDAPSQKTDRFWMKFFLQYQGATALSFILSDMIKKSS
ncbi:hypothetical protein J21TS3_11630 [Paenibacillus cookii]|uniref:Uncharacterized protein n=1 Tax=Paenibacillus cookii TaxID=157839 RepID=A0ABQ4LSS5_9BACL|nr:hypothetical protein J21TS3_11630 [Paenibacillus cookii]